MATGKVVTQTATYYGPSASVYTSDGSYAGPNDAVTILWQEGSWFYIEYPAGTKRKRMYISANAVSSITGSVVSYTPSLLPRYVSASANTYAGPSSSMYTQIETLGVGAQVMYLDGQKDGDFAMLEIDIANGKKRRIWFEHMKMEASKPPVSPVARADCNISSSAYTAPQNKYSKGQCTWFCWGRAKEKTGKTLSFTGGSNGGQWYSNINAAGSNVTKRPPSLGPVANSVASFSGGSQGYGHVIFIESVENDYTYFREWNFNQSQNGVMQKIETSSLATFRPKFTLNGYIVL